MQLWFSPVDGGEQRVGDLCLRFALTDGHELDGPLELLSRIKGHRIHAMQATEDLPCEGLGSLLASSRPGHDFRDMASLAQVARVHGITDQRLLRVMRNVHRSGFVPPKLAHLANRDVPIPIGHDQVTTQPSLVASMVEALELDGHEAVLEVGSGYGYQTALLAHLARHIWSIERWPDLAEHARSNLGAAGITNVDVVTGDGSEGLARFAPFDAVIIAAAFPKVPAPLVDQLIDGGRLVQPIGPGGAEDVTLFVKSGSGLNSVRVITRAYFVPLVGACGFDQGFRPGGR